MINLLPIGRLIAAIAVVYAAITCFILWLIYSPSASVWVAIGIATGGSAILNGFILIGFHFGWEALWNKYPSLNRILFPNLNGSWKMHIHWEGKKGPGVSIAKASITQDFINIAMDVEADDSDSHTLMAKPKKDPESGSPLLYYVFLTTPKAASSTKDKSPYKGAAILKLSIENEDKLIGNYFTSRKTIGHYELHRIKTT